MAEDESPLQSYLERFRNLRRGRSRFGGDLAPHKPVMLLALSDLLAQGQVSENRVPFDERLLAAFRANWELLQVKGWDRNPALPFVHLSGDGFWHLRKKEGRPSPQPKVSELLDQGAEATLDDQLFRLLQDETARSALRHAVLDAYFPGKEKLLHLADHDLAIVRSIDERLASYVSHPFVADWKAAGLREDGAFADMVMRLYDYTCSVCRLRLWSPRNVTLIQAAHVMARSETGNFDPRNGVALCANHHWAFDHGLFTFTRDHRVEVAADLDERIPTEWAITQHQDVRIRLPKDPRLVPHPTAIDWHRARFFGTRSRVGARHR